MAKFLFAIEVDDESVTNPTSLDETEVEGLESAFQAIEAVTDATYIGLAYDYGIGRVTNTD